MTKDISNIIFFSWFGFGQFWRVMCDTFHNFHMFLCPNQQISACNVSTCCDHENVKIQTFVEFKWYYQTPECEEIRTVKYVRTYIVRFQTRIGFYQHH